MFAALRKYPVTQETQDWVTDELIWAIEEGLLTTKTPLVLPTQDFFPAKSGTPEIIVRGLLDDILQLLGRANDKIECLPINRPATEYRVMGSVGVLSEMAGGWTTDGETSVIFYDPEMVARPATLLATLIHEVMHHLLHEITSPEDAEFKDELATDFLAISTGFGLIQVMGAEQAGWLGYMQQTTRLHALALFLRIRGLPDTSVRPYLSSRAQRWLSQSLQHIDNGRPLYERGLSIPKTTHRKDAL